MYKTYLKSIFSLVLVAGLIMGCSSDDSQQSPTPDQQPQAQQQGPQQGQGSQNPMMQKQQSIDPSSITDAELEQFAQAMQKASKIQTEARSDMKKIVEDEGLTFKRFQQIMMSKRSKKLKQKMNVTDEEQAKMDAIQPRMQEAQKSARQEITKAIESTGISMDRFKQIGRALRQNKDLMKRYKEMQGMSGATDTTGTGQ